LIGLAVALRWGGSSIASVFIVAKWWPVIFVLLGIEIVVAGILAGQDEPRLKYDWVGIFAIILIVTSGMCLEVADATGLLPEARHAAQSVVYNVTDLPTHSIPVETGVLRAVVDCDADLVEVRTSSSNSITAFASGSVAAISGDEVGEWAQGFTVVTRRDGDTYHLSLETPPDHRGPWRTAAYEKWVLLVPQGLDLDLSASAKVEAVARELAADWLITVEGQVSVVLGTDEDLEIVARTRAYHSIDGNVPWSDSIEETSSESPEPVEEIRRSDDDWTTRGATLGIGSHALQIRASQNILVETPSAPDGAR